LAERRGRYFEGREAQSNDRGERRRGNRAVREIREAEAREACEVNPRRNSRSCCSCSRTPFDSIWASSILGWCFEVGGPHPPVFCKNVIRWELSGGGVQRM